MRPKNGYIANEQYNGSGEVHTMIKRRKFTARRVLVGHTDRTPFDKFSILQDCRKMPNECILHPGKVCLDGPRTGHKLASVSQDAPDLPGLSIRLGEPGADEIKTVIPSHEPTECGVK